MTVQVSPAFDDLFHSLFFYSLYFWPFSIITSLYILHLPHSFDLLRHMCMTNHVLYFFYQSTQPWCEPVRCHPSSLCAPASSSGFVQLQRWPLCWVTSSLLAKLLPVALIIHKNRYLHGVLDQIPVDTKGRLSLLPIHQKHCLSRDLQETRNPGVL